jgi:hypothetical protein
MLVARLAKRQKPLIAVFPWIAFASVNPVMHVQRFFPITASTTPEIVTLHDF